MKKIIEKSHQMIRRPWTSVDMSTAGGGKLGFLVVFNTPNQPKTLIRYKIGKILHTPAALLTFYVNVHFYTDKFARTKNTFLVNKQRTSN